MVGDGSGDVVEGAAAGRYCVAEVGSYYVPAEEPKGRWFGDAATPLGLSGVVDDGQFVAVMNGVDPLSGVGLGQAFGEKSVRGYDVTFSAPKFGVGPRRPRRPGRPG